MLTPTLELRDDLLEGIAISLRALDLPVRRYHQEGADLIVPLRFINRVASWLDGESWNYNVYDFRCGEPDILAIKIDWVTELLD
jgi:hypothetical protein